MKLYNTKTLEIEEFKPLVEKEVSMYVCGPTVYNHAHIGNARPIIVFDTLRRVFEALEYTVRYVSNYTDVDDRIIEQALSEGVSEADITEKYIEAYETVREKLNTRPLSSAPKVTETMNEIIQFIQSLMEVGFAYEVNGDVFFRVGKAKNYGEISHQNLEDLQVGARIEENIKKESPLDFALWKKTEQGLRWDSPWGKGRPGWHTECVVMIQNEFKKTLIDIHGGGQDLRFPHHENEVAQCQALHETSLANYWLHNGMINIDGAKMSKSLGNFTFAKDVLEQYDANLIRWFMLSVHYRMELNFTEEAFDVAKKELDKINQALKQAYILLSFNQVVYPEKINAELIQPFMEAMQDDLNTPNAYTAIFDLVKRLNQALRNKSSEKQEIAELVVAIEQAMDILGIPKNRIEMTTYQREQYEKWNEAKVSKNFDEADRLRNILQEEGIL